MRASQLEPFIGLPYDPESFDCADLAILLQARLFGRTITLPGRRQRAGAPVALINRYRDELATRIAREQLQDGDVILFKGGTLHLGTVFHLACKTWVLHTTTTGGHSMLQPLEVLPAPGLAIEGYYRWK